MFSQIDIDGFIDELDNKGFVVIKNCYSDSLMKRVKEEYNSVKEKYIDIQKNAGLNTQSKNATHHTLLMCPSFLELLDKNPLASLLETYFGGKYILYTMGASSKMPDSEYVYTQKVHREFYTFTFGQRLMLNSLILLDDCDVDSGATWMLSGSHTSKHNPSEDEFFKRAERVCANRGDIIIFDANIWHAAGLNKTDQSVDIITPLYTKPFIKQALNYPRAFGLDFAHQLSDELKQVLGYNAIVPETLQEFYKPEEHRFYKRNQE